MRAKWVIITACCLEVAFMLGGCAGTTAPRGWLPTAAESQTNAFGAWARVEMIDTNLVFEGELIAVCRDTLFLLADTITGIPRDLLYRVVLTRYAQEHGPIGVWTLVGTLSTVSHGWVLALTAPTWIISGTIAASSVSREPMVRPQPADFKPMPAYTFETLAPYARFPQGLPVSIDRSTLTHSTTR